MQCLRGYDELNQLDEITSFVALYDDIPVGSCTFKLKEEFRADLGPWLADVVVAPKHQKQGIGKMLVKAAALKANELGLLGQTIMPEDSNPGIKKMKKEDLLAYFTLPMALNYQRNSYKLWEAALKTFNDPKTKFVFNINAIIYKP